MGVMVLAPITGAGFNPARSFGPMLVSGAWDDFLLLYLIGPLLGALIAALACFHVFVQPGRKGEQDMTPVG
jgi:glycerol uptake facilitator-like aquaporin